MEEIIDLKIKNVLIVDDSESMRQIVRRVLETLGVRIFEGTKVKEGLQILLQKPIDLLITDGNMLDMDGLEFTRILRAHSLFEQLPILMLSNHSSEECRQQALEAGISVFVAKDAPFDEWRTQMKRLLG